MAAAARPFRYEGQINFDLPQAQGYAPVPFASGGAGRGSAPFGEWPIQTYQQGSGANYGLTPGGVLQGWPVGTTPTGTMADPLYPNAPRDEIMIHAGRSDDLDAVFSAGCLSIPQDQWPAFRDELKAAQQQYGALVVVLSPNGQATIRPASAGDHYVSADTFIGQSQSRTLAATGGATSTAAMAPPMPNLRPGDAAMPTPPMPNLRPTDGGANPLATALAYNAPDASPQSPPPAPPAGSIDFSNYGSDAPGGPNFGDRASNAFGLSPPSGWWPGQPLPSDAGDAGSWPDNAATNFTQPNYWTPSTLNPSQLSAMDGGGGSTTPSAPSYNIPPVSSLNPSQMFAMGDYSNYAPPAPPVVAPSIWQSNFDNWLSSTPMPVDDNGKPLRVPSPLAAALTSAPKPGVSPRSATMAFAPPPPMPPPRPIDPWRQPGTDNTPVLTDYGYGGLGTSYTDNPGFAAFVYGN